MEDGQKERRKEGRRKGAAIVRGEWMVLLVGGQVRERFLAVVPWREFVKVK